MQQTTQVAANSFATQTAQAPTAISPLISPEVVAEIDDLLDKLAEQDLFTGSVLLAHQGKVLISQGYGLADREQNIPNTPQTRYRIASMTKQFTAMAILILEAQGKLDVKDPICIYIADCPSTWEAITIHHLLTHTSGIPDYLSLPYYGSSRATPSAPLQTIARFKDLLLNFQPGEKFSYSNSGYIVLGYIIEQVSGQTYQDFLQQSIFTPLNLRDLAMITTRMAWRLDTKISIPLFQLISSICRSHMRLALCILQLKTFTDGIKRCIRKSWFRRLIWTRCLPHTRFTPTVVGMRMATDGG